MTKKDGLERLVEQNLSELTEGIAYIAVGKPATGKGFRLWQMKILYHEYASRGEFGAVRRLIGEDPNTILFNTYDSGWVGIEEDGSYKSMKDVASRIRNAYKIRLCRAEYDDVDALMPPDMRAEYEAEMARRIAVKEERE